MALQQRNPAPGGTGCGAAKVCQSGRLNASEDNDTPPEKQDALREAVLAELRLIRARLALAVVSLDAIGIATRRRLISTRQAIELSNPLIAEFADRSFEREFVARVMCDEPRRRRNAA